MLIEAAEPRPAPFMVAVLRRDGFLIPFATFDGKNWSNRWPAPTASNLQVPVNLDSVPKRWWGPTAALQEWQTWTGAESRVVHVQQPDWVDVHCLRQVVLRTDYRSPQPAPPLSEQPYPKDGLAVSPPHAVKQIEIVPVAALEAQALATVLRNAFNRAERDTSEHFHHPVTEKTRERIEPNTEAVYAFGTALRTYYVEAARGYRASAGREDECAVAFGTGWFSRDGPDVLRQLDMAVDLLPCNRYGATYMLPLGVIPVGDRTFWIVQYSSSTHERFVVVEIKKNRVEAVINAFGGAC